MIDNIYVRVITEAGVARNDYTPYKSGVYRMVSVTQIPVRILENEQDWEYSLIDAGDGVKRLAVF